MIAAIDDGHALDDLQSIVAFVRVVEATSFTLAARSLSSTTSTVSKRVARLEQRLGVRLVERTTRGLAITEVGRDLYPRFAHILSEMEAAEFAVSRYRGTPRGTLRVIVDEALGDRALAGLTADFLEEYPELQLVISSGDAGIDLVRRGYDVALRIGAHAGQPHQSQRIRRVGAVDFVVCAAPAYLSAAGVPATPDDLAHHACIQIGERPFPATWTLCVGGAPREVTVHSRVRFSSVSSARAAALAGIGLISLPRACVADELRAGSLRAALNEYALSDVPVYLLHPGGKAQCAAKASAFAEFLARRLPQRLQEPARAASQGRQRKK